jgi:DNA-nicking Smr family endonuclease
MQPADEDVKLFREAVSDAQPLAAGDPAPRRPAPAPVARFRRADEAAVLDESLLGNPEAEDGTGQDLSFHRPSVSPAVFRRLKRGEYSVREELDLHGLSATQARQALSEFLAEARDAGWHCVRIIHGKGLRSGHAGPVIKRRIGRWLTVRDEVLAYCSARPIDGGTGALYVLLRPR